MAEADTRTDAGAPTEQLLDPFRFFPGVASRILGLGGNAPGYDHTYAFHTEYVEAAPGRAHFTVRFAGLKARCGTLQLWVHMLPLETGAHARVVNSQRIQLNRLIQLRGEHAITFESFHGVSFALHGAIVDDTDAIAEALVVALDRPADPTARSATTKEARTSSFGREQTRPDANLISVAPPSLAWPVSQCATRAQARDRLATSALDLPGAPAPSPIERWRFAYLLQVLRCYGMAEPGARGLAFDPGRSAFGEALGQLGPDVSFASTAVHEVGDGTFDPTSMAGDAVNFDFLWSSGIGAQLGSSRQMIDFAVTAMDCLRPGGLAVHLLPFDPVGCRSSWPGGNGPFTRNEIERLALAMILRGHEVAQIKVDTSDALLHSPAGTEGASIGEFGVIVRRAASAL